ncbi:MAG: FAD-dependent oxidoreductase [Bacteroidota bacterium]
MHLRSGLPFWLIRDGLPFDHPVFDKPIKTNVVIIGAGISGALLGYHLVEAGIDAIVVVRGSIGLGSTCTNISLLHYEIDDPMHQMVDRLGYINVVRCYQPCSKSIDTLHHIEAR